MALSNHILTIIEPSIERDKQAFNSYNEETGQSNTSEDMGKDWPLIIINNYMFMQEDITSLEIDASGVVPKISLSIIDNQGYFSVDTYPRDGDVITVRIAAMQKNVYKDIHIDFDIDDVQSPPQQSITYGYAGKYSFTGTMKIPGLFAEVCKFYEADSSLNQLQTVASDLGLGFATNIQSTDDNMNMIIANDSYLDSITKRVEHSYIGDDSFQTFAIDPYYYLNYVDFNALIESPEEDFETVMLNFDENPKDMPGQDNAANEGEASLILTSHSNAVGTSGYIQRFALINKSGKAAKLNGYKKTLQYFENDSDEGLVSFELESLSSSKMKDIEEPLKGRRDEERYKLEVKTKYMGRIDADPENSNMHLNHNFARLHNKQNLDELQKMFLEVELAAFNPTIHKYQKIPVAIFHESRNQVQADNEVKKRKEEDGFEASAGNDKDQNNSAVSRAKMDDFLSGYYVIAGIKYRYSRKMGKLTQVLTLFRREWPSRINNIG